MTLNSKQLTNLPVFTESGTKIGKVSFIEINEKEHIVEKYAVKSSAFGQFVSAVLLISPRQVIEINSTKMIVEEDVVKIIKRKNKQKNTPVEDPSPVVFIDITQ